MTILYLSGVAGSAFLLFLALAVPRLAFVAWVALIPLFFVLRSCTQRGSFGWSWLGGTLFFAAHLYWISIPVLDHGGALSGLGIAGLILLYLIMGLFWGCFGYLGHRALHSWWSHPLLTVPILWTALELLRELILYPLPLGFLGYALAPYPALIQTADLWGTGGLTFLLALGNAALFLFMAERLSFKGFILSVLCLLLILLPYGHWQLGQDQNPLLTLGLVQPNIPQEEKWDHIYRDRNIERHLDLTKPMGNHVDMVVWPESAVPLDPSRHYEWSRFEEDLMQIPVPLFLGLLTREDGNVYNSSFLVLGGEVIRRYDKTWLVPFGEYIPLSALFGWVDTGFRENTPGEELVVFQHGDWQWSSPICYEILNSSLVRKMSSDAEFLLHLSNEAWFKDSLGLRLLWSVGIVRAVEVRRPIVKVANTGYSGYVNDRGQEQALLPPLEEGKGIVTVESAGVDTTFFARWGQGPLIALLFIFFILARIVGPGIRRWGEQPHL